ncbi:unknown [Bacteroides eggerthii CAG:109]|nr:unknown [Bacteroides eggerthii CAG:109]
MRFYKMQICSNLLIFICIMSHGVLLDFVLCLPASSTDESANYLVIK